MIQAAGRGSQKELARLKREGADLNASWRGYRALHSLIQEESHASPRPPSRARLAYLQWLLANGADPEQLGAWPPARAILIATWTGEPAYVDALRRSGAVVDGFVAAALGDRRRVEGCLKKDRAFALRRDNAGWTALQCCCASRMGSSDPTARRNLLAIAKRLLDHGADVTARIKSWSHDVDACGFAVASGRRDILKLLLERGAGATAALTPAVWRNDREAAEIALRFGARIDRARDGTKPLLNQMIRWGQVKQALWLLEKGASPNTPDERGWTAAHQAASRGNERLMKAVLEAGGDLSRKDHEGRTPRDIASRMRRPKMAALLTA